jgi:GT2 family glycosyltransferase
MNITFCINTARNERHHIELLFRSLYKNLSHRDHPILVYVENDNQGTTEFLKTQKEYFPNLKIIINPLPVPLGYARNINMMFEMAETDVVSYLQSDMVVCARYDLEVAKYLTPDNIISSTRIEPPLHPPSPEKITHDFGLDPQKFDLDAFTLFAEDHKTDRITNFWFAPFTLYKKNWLDIGGHDTLFRRSREDSDLLYRFTMKGTKIEQAWNAIVYHFTCTSSRGIEWWTDKAKARTQLQQQADTVEMTRFMRKWPRFKHDTSFDPATEYKYPVSVNFKNTTWHNCIAIFQHHHRFDKIYIDNSEMRENLHLSFDQLHGFANQLLDINGVQWELYKVYYRTVSGKDVFVESPITDADVVLDLDPTTMDVFTDPTILQINDIIHVAEAGQYECGTGVLTINRVVNRIQDNLIVKNPSINDIDFVIL